MNDRIDPVEQAKAQTPPYVPTRAGLPLNPKWQQAREDALSEPAPGTSPWSGRTDLTEAEQKYLADRFKDATLAQPGYTIEPALHEFVPTPTAWKSMPGTVRFAVWLWTITVIVGFTAGVIALLVLWVGGAFALSQM